MAKSKRTKPEDRNRRITQRVGAEKLRMSTQKPPLSRQAGRENEGGDEKGCACEADRLSVATSQPNVVVDPVTGLTDVIRNAWFVAYFKHNACCDCCEFRQYVRGFFELNGTVVPGPFPGFNFRFWQEDQDAAGEMYGHRDRPGEDGDRYVPDQADGCIYLGRDTPGFYGLSSGDDYSILLEFADVIIDTCNNDDVVAGPKLWDLIAAGTVP